MVVLLHVHCNMKDTWRFVNVLEKVQQIVKKKKKKANNFNGNNSSLLKGCFCPFVLYQRSRSLHPRFFVEKRHTEKNELGVILNSI